jgi:undecaprenyl-diphosphatase
VWLEHHRRHWIELERSCALWLHGAAAWPSLVKLLVAISWLGDGALWYGIVAVLPWWGGASGTACALRLLGLGALNVAIYKIIKRRFARPRPYKTCPGIHACAPSLDEYSFPSGHTMHAAAFSLVLASYYPQLGVPLWAFTLLMALSRVVLGLHYPSDVLIGAAIGFTTAKLTLALWF